MAVQMTPEQFQQLLETLRPPQQPPPPQQAQHKSAAALGPMRQLDMGPEKIRRLIKFNEWLEEAENRMTYIGITTDEERISLLRSWGGQELVTFMKLHAKVRFEPTPAPEAGEPDTPKDNCTNNHQGQSGTQRTGQQNISDA